MECEHIICKFCLKLYLQEVLKKFPIDKIHCPADNCYLKIPSQTLIELGFQNQVKLYIEKYYEYEKFNSGQIQFCPNFGYQIQCKNISTKLIKCICGFHFCSKCLKYDHKDVSCEENIMNKFYRFFRGNKLQPCPECLSISKYCETCNKMKCEIENHSFCFYCSSQTCKESILSYCFLKRKSHLM